MDPMGSRTPDVEEQLRRQEARGHLLRRAALALLLALAATVIRHEMGPPRRSHTAQPGAPAAVEPASGTPQVPGSTEEPVAPDAEGVIHPALIEESRVQPQYPEQARLARVQGRVVLEAIISREGRVRVVRAVKVDPDGYGFETAAREAVEQWRYRPATKNGEPVEVYFTVVVDFSLKEP